MHTNEIPSASDTHQEGGRPPPSRPAIASEFGLPTGDDVLKPVPVWAVSAAPTVEASIEEDALQAAFVEQATVEFVGRKALLARLDEFVASDVQTYGC